MLTPDELWLSLTDEERGKLLAAAGQLAATAPPPVQLVPDPGPRLAAVPDPGPAELEDDYADLDSLDEDYLRVSFQGTHYDIPACDIETGLLCQRLMGAGARARSGRAPSKAQQDQLDDAEETELFIDLLGGRQYRTVDPWTRTCPMCAAKPGVACDLADDLADDLAEGESHYLRGQVSNPFYDPERDLWARVKAEGRSWPFVQHLGTTAIFWAAFGAETALEFWKSGGRPKPQPAPTPRAPQDHKPKARKGTATTTRKRGSGTSTAKTT